MLLPFAAGFKKLIYVSPFTALCLQGRGPNTQVYTHALEAGHHMFMKASNGWLFVAYTLLFARQGWLCAGFNL